MKILYITQGEHLDYQNDCLLIGLKELYGSDVIDVNKRLHLYTTFDQGYISNLYGKGMTVTRVLPDLEVDRLDVFNKIRNTFFDYVVYGSIWRDSSYLEECLLYYKPHRIILVDGEDHPNISHLVNLGVRYFKRELYHYSSRITPISFAFPTNKVNFSKDKLRDYAFITPLEKNTYIYESEEEYYNDYRKSRFAITIKKSGWDCLRHYEIIANGCLPIFHNIERCPDNTLTLFPKQMCANLNQFTLNNSMANTFDQFADQFQSHFTKNNTTESLAKYFIDQITKFN